MTGNTEAAIQAHLMSVGLFKTLEGSFRNRAPYIQCADETTLSVQAGPQLFCLPRRNQGPWSQVEVGYPSKAMPELEQYAEKPKRLTKTIYKYVPIEVVAAAIDACGGITGEKN